MAKAATRPRTAAFTSGNLILPFLAYSLLLLAGLIAYLGELMPVKTQAERDHWVEGHQSGRNAMIAQKMIERILPSPLTRWSDYPPCKPLGHGIWAARGRVGVQTSSGEKFLDWGAVFIPEPPQSLYLRAGTSEQGDLRAALIQAGVQP